MLIAVTHRTKVTASYWGFGLLNNLLYVVILSAAVDLVGQRTPKSVVLLADVLPSFVLKLTAPFFIHNVPYATRITLLVALSFVGMQLVALAPQLLLRIVGIMLASTSSGLGEITFLQLTHYYDEDAIHGWSSGTGGAGLVGSFVFMALTSWLSINTKIVLLIFSLMPFCILSIYFWLLPSPHQPIQSPQRSNRPSSPIVATSRTRTTRTPLDKLKPLFGPYIIPLTTVYICEYIINQGISPTLLFPIEEMPFASYRDAYVTYGTLYQIGVFISRSSGRYFRLSNVSITAILQLSNLILAIVQALYMLLPSVWILMILIVYEGLLGGLAYVNTFMLVSEKVSPEDREFSMGSVTMSDSSGIVIAGLVSLWLEKALCRYQIGTGRPWCELP